jgi:branched-chain amino acid transport system permease protein
VKLFETLVTGITQGAMIGLVALGYTLVYGVLKLINFAHSEVFMMGAYLGLFAIMALGGTANPMLAGIGGTLMAMVGSALIGFLGLRGCCGPQQTHWEQRPGLEVRPTAGTAIGLSPRRQA